MSSKFNLCKNCYIQISLIGPDHQAFFCWPFKYVIFKFHQFMSQQFQENFISKATNILFEKSHGAIPPPLLNDECSDLMLSQDQLCVISGAESSGWHTSLIGRLTLASFPPFPSGVEQHFPGAYGHQYSHTWTQENKSLIKTRKKFNQAQTLKIPTNLLLFTTF